MGATGQRSRQHRRAADGRLSGAPAAGDRPRAEPAAGADLHRHRPDYRGQPGAAGRHAPPGTGAQSAGLRYPGRTGARRQPDGEAEGDLPGVPESAGDRR